MATARAIANGNWSATSTWNGGVLPGNGDTVYANGFNVTLDVDVNIGGANNPIVNTGSLVSGQWYEIVNVGGQNWTTLGAASNTVGTVFQSTGTGTSGNLGTARALATLTTLTNTAANATTGGGVFTMSTIRAMTADLRAGTTTCLNVTATTGTLLLNGLRVVGGPVTAAHGVNTTANSDLASCTFTGGGSSAFALNNASTGTVNVSSACTFTGGNNANTLNNASTGTVNVSASCTFTGGSGVAFTLNNASTGTVNVSASCTFTGGVGSNSAFALNNASTGTVNVSASCTFTGGSGGSAFALNNASTGTVIVTGSTFTASAFTNAANIASTAADVRLSGDFLDHWSGWRAVNGAKWRLGTTPSAARTRYALAGTTDSYVEMFTADNATFGQPAISNVRAGVVYGGGILTGICAVPAAGSVALGVPVDNTTGTAVLTAAAVQSALTSQGLTTARASALDNLDTTVSSRLAPSGTLATVTNLTNAPASVTPADIWSHATRTLTSASGSAPTAEQNAAAVWSAAARTITGGTVDTLTNAPTVPSAAAIATQVWAVADKTGYSLTSAERSAIAAAVEASILNDGDGQAILNAIVAAIGNSNVDQVALVAAIRSDLERNGGKLDGVPAAVRSNLATELGRIDAAISTRLAGSAYTAPANSDITAIKAKTDNLPASPAATSDIPSANIAAIKAKTDALPASPAATGDIPSANIAAIKAKTDALNTDRLAQVSTVSTTGAQLAAALS